MSSGTSLISGLLAEVGQAAFNPMNVVPGIGNTLPAGPSHPAPFE